MLSGKIDSSITIRRHQPGDAGYIAYPLLYEEFGFALSEEKEKDTWKNQLIEQRFDVTLRA